MSNYARQFVLLSMFAGASWGAAIGAPIRQLRDLAAVGGGQILFLSLFMILLNAFLF